MSKSERQARMEKERDEMLKMEYLAKVEFDNTKRIERPKDIMEKRWIEREYRNQWYMAPTTWKMA